MTPKAKKRPQIKLIVDTNSLKSHEDNKYFASRSFKDRITKLKESADITVLVPQVVYLEIVVQKIENLRAAHDAILKSSKTLASLTGVTAGYEQDLKAMEENLKSSIKSDLELSGYEIIPLEVGQHFWGKIIDAAIWRNGAFGAADPSALKDAVIGAIAVGYSRTSTGSKIVYLTNDKNAGELAYFPEEDTKKLIVLRSLESLAPIIGDLNKESAARLTNIRAIATARFKSFKPKYLYWEWRLEDRFSKLSKRIDEIHDPNQIRLSLYGWPYFRPPQISVEPPVTEIVDEIGEGLYKFETRVSKAYSNYSDVSDAVAKRQITEYQFSVTWTAKLENNELTDEKLIDVNIVGEPKTSEITLTNPNYMTASAVLNFSNTNSAATYANYNVPLASLISNNLSAQPLSTFLTSAMFTPIKSDIHSSENIGINKIKTEFLSGSDDESTKPNKSP